jgi:thiol:disulfide interchange protein DsbD
MASKKILPLIFIVMLTCIPDWAFAQAGIAEMNSWIEGKLAADNTSIASYFFLFLGGLLASLLPCVYPLYPITANVIKARGAGSSRFIHPLSYFIGLAIMYLIFGVVASFSGGAFNHVMRLPTTNLIIGITIITMGISAAGFIHISLFGGQTDTKNNGVFGTFLLGMGAGLLASSCVGPVVVSILIGLASNMGGEFSFLSATASAFKMLSFGLGLGIPFLLIGVFGVSLPKSGKWMMYVQYILGIVIVYFGWTYIEKALLIYNFSDEAIRLIGIGSLIVVISSYYFQSSERLVDERIKKSLLILSSIIGALILTRGFMPIPSTPSAPEAMSAQAVTTRTEKKGKLTWYLDKEGAYAEAKKTGKNVFIDFYANWCTNCKAFEKMTHENEPLIASLENAVLLKIYDTTPEFKAYSVDSRFPELKVGLPFFVITNNEGDLIYKTNDYMKTEEMGLFLNE